jgi:hypothetical protein
MRGRLNSFQRTMLHWNEMHPYGAIHVARIARPTDPERIRETINAVFERRGIGRVEIDRQRKSYRYHPGASDCEIEFLDAHAESEADLTGIIERELNRRFDASGAFCPVRFFVMPADGGFWLGLVYFHAVADAISIVYLLRELVHACCEGVDTIEAEPPNLYPPRFDNLLWHRPGVLVRKLLRLPGEISSSRSTNRPPYEDPQDTVTGFKLFTLSVDELRGLLTVSKAWKVTLNDLFLAVMLKVFSRLAPAERMQKKRRKISVGSIVNLRGDHGLKGDDHFGLFLGSFAVSHEVPPEIDLKSLAAAVGGQTRGIKKSGAPLAFPLQLAFARFVLRFFSLERRWKFYQKYRPLWGGITNMNLNAIRHKPGEVPPADYVRGVATGPATPLVLSVTTTGDFVHIGMSYRKTVFAEPMIEEFQCAFTGTLAEVAKQS